MSANTLRVQMLGKFSITYRDRQISCSGSRSGLIWNILAYLLCHRGEYISAEDLISIVWKHENNNNPAGAMRTAIHRVRSMLNELTEDASIRFLIVQNGAYSWNPDVEISVDADEFEHLCMAAAEHDDLSEGLAALNLYDGKFLPPQSSEVWVIPIQTYYHNLYEALIDRVVPLLEREKRYSEGIQICRKALQIDFYSEKLYQHLMRLLLAENSRQEVAQVYEEMSKLFLSTFGIMPDQESRALYREALRTDTNSVVVSPETAHEQLKEQGEINGALICDYDFFRMMYQAQARAIVRSGQVIHTALLTIKSRSGEVSEKSLSIAMDNLEKQLCGSLRKGDVITRCSSSQFMIMLPSANYENSCMVCRRCISAFERKHPHSPVYVDYFVQPLAPSTVS